MASIILLAGLVSLKGIPVEILAADLSCKENKYMHSLGYLVSKILHAYSYVAMYTSVQLRSYVYICAATCIAMCVQTYVVPTYVYVHT